MTSKLRWPCSSRAWVSSAQPSARRASYSSLTPNAVHAESRSGRDERRTHREIWPPLRAAKTRSAVAVGGDQAACDVQHCGGILVCHPVGELAVQGCFFGCGCHIARAQVYATKAHEVGAGELAWVFVLKRCQARAIIVGIGIGGPRRAGWVFRIAAAGASAGGAPVPADAVLLKSAGAAATGVSSAVELARAQPRVGDSSDTQA